MVRWLVVGFVAVWGTGSVAAQPQGSTVELRGEVVSLVDSAPVTDVDLRLVGYGPLRITQSGAFVVEIPRGTREVQLTLVDDPTRAILYPVDGRLPVPNDEGTVVTIVVDRSMQDILAEELSRRFAQLEQVVQGQGQQYRASLSDVDSLLRRALDAREDEFEASVAFHKEKLTVVPPLMEAVDHYVLEVEDMKDALRLFAPHASQDLAAVLSLQAAMKEYNSAYVELNRLRNAAVSRVRSLWSGGEGERMAGLTEDFFHAAQALHEQYVLSLNDPFVTIQLANSQSVPPKEEVEEALQRIRRTAEDLDTEVARLVRAKDVLFRTLDAGG